MSEHIVPVKVYVTIFLALMVGTAVTVLAAFQNFPGRFECDCRDDYRGREGHTRRALFHARSLQRATHLGDCRFRAFLDGNSLRSHVQRLLDQRLVVIS